MAKKQTESQRMALLFLPEGAAMVVLPNATQMWERAEIYDALYPAYYEVALFTLNDGKLDPNSIASVRSTFRCSRGGSPPVKVLSHLPEWAKMPVDTDYEQKLFQKQVTDFLHKKGVNT